VKELERGGIKREGIRFLIASGTHRPMTEEEILIKFGKEIPKKHPFFNHRSWDSSQLVYLGETPSGIPIHINRLVEEVDLIIGIGQIVPIGSQVSAVETSFNQGSAAKRQQENTLAQCPIRWLGDFGKDHQSGQKEIERVAEKAGLEWIINTIQDGTGRLVKVVAGDPVHAYREGASHSREVYQSQLPEEADIVIADSHPYDSELWLAAKGIYAAELAVKQGGVVILITSCPEGISVSHPEVLELGYQTFEEVDQKVRRGEIKKLTVAAHLVHVGRVIKERASGILVSPGISKEQAERLGFIYARDPQEALEIAFSQLSRDAKVAVLQRGGEILPVIKDSL
jgi:nickel-dependent lactate racemase